MTRPNRRRGALGAVLGATAAALAAPVPAPAAPGPGAEPEPIRVCWTQALSPEEVDAGETSEITCATTSATAGRAAALLAGGTAIHYDGANGTGSELHVGGTCGSRLDIPAGDWWNNRISSTEFVSCGNVKHYVGGGGTGASQLTTGVAGGVVNLNGTLNNQVSSVDYG
jgi:hypothetical protein